MSKQTQNAARIDDSRRPGPIDASPSPEAMANLELNPGIINGDVARDGTAHADELREAFVFDSIDQSLWRALYHFNLYRLVLSCGFVVLGLSNARIANFGSVNPGLFLVASLLLAAVSVIAMITIHRGQPAFPVQASFQILCDIFLITVMMHASGGISSGLGLLLLISMAAAGVVLPGRLAISLAAIATLAMGAETFSSAANARNFDALIANATMLCLGLFVTAIVVSALAIRIREAEQLADQRAEDLMTLARVNAHIVTQLDSGVLIVDSHDRIYFSNERARMVLAIPGTGSGARLDDISTDLASAAARWRAGDEDYSGTVVEVADADERFTPRFVSAGNDDTDGILIFLDNVTLTEKKAQQLKLASLGRLTAAISHEIRNPLAALSHASELLAESRELTKADRRLVQITVEQSERINTIIRSVLQFSRRSEVTRQSFDLLEWCESTAEQIALDHGLPKQAIDVDGESANVRINAGQLQQILSNLCDNAIRHSPEYVDKPVVSLEIIRSSTGAIRLDVVDHGSGIDENTASHLFEPFFTTHVKGTGLGLYICRELCQANGASLNYIEDGEPGSRFRVVFESGNKGSDEA